MRISPRWYAVPVNLVLLIILLYLLAFSLKQARVVPDINEGAFVAAAIRYAFLIALPFLLFSAVFSIRTVQRLPGDEAARLIFRYWKDALPQSKDDLSEAIGSTKGVCHTKTPKMCLHIVDVEDLPEKFRGVFWMSTDPSPELCTNFEAASFDAASRMLQDVGFSVEVQQQLPSEEE
ncbi:unnamed protein product, partial [Durusdinium trenchii]